MKKVSLMVMVQMCFLVCTVCCFAQTQEERLQALRAEYSSLSNLHISMTIKVFADSSGQDPIYEEVAEIKRRNEDYAYRTGSTELMMNDKYIVVVDRDTREIMATRRDVRGEARFSDSPLHFNLDSLMLAHGLPQFVDSVAGVDHYQVKHNKGMITRTDIFVRRQGNVLERILYQYEDGQHVVIHFDRFSKTPTFDDSVFNEGRYFSQVKGLWKPAYSYAGYHVIVMNGTR